MENKEEILKKLNSSDIELVGESIDEIMKNGDISLLENIIETIGKTEDEAILFRLVSLISDIRINEIRDVVINHIKNTDSVRVKTNLLRVCWESALDFSGYYEVFVDILINEELSIALEAFTNLEEILHHLPKEDNDRIVSLISGKLSGDKSFMYDSLLNEIANIDYDDSVSERGDVS